MVNITKECPFCEHFINGKKQAEFCNKCSRNADLYGDFFRLDKHLEAYLEKVNSNGIKGQTC